MAPAFQRVRGVGEGLIGARPRVRVAVVLAAGILLFLRAPVTACPCDCDGDNIVLISELLLGINIALGREPVSSCPMSDVDISDAVTVDELVAHLS